MTVKPGWGGRFYEDIDPGDIYRHPLGRTITEADNTWFTLLTMNTNQIHFNSHAAHQGEFGKLIVNSAFTIALVMGQSVIDTSHNAFANLSIDELRLTKPVFVGDTIYAESKVLGKRESESRPYAGIIHIATRGINQNADVVLSYHRKFFLYKRDSVRGRADHFPVPAEPFEISE